MQNIAGYSIELLANVRWRKVLADIGLLIVGLLTCSVLRQGSW